MDHPLATRYLADFDAALTGLAADERTEVVAEIRQHIADAIAAGKAIDDVLTSLGPVDALARGYRLELLVSPRASAPEPRSDRWLKIIGLLAVGSLPTFIIVVALGSIGISLSLAGFVVVMAGIADSTGALPGFIQGGVEPWVAIVIGVLVLGAGLLASWGTVAYVRFVIRLVRRVVPARTGVTTTSPA